MGCNPFRLPSVHDLIQSKEIDPVVLGGVCASRKELVHRSLKDLRDHVEVSFAGNVDVLKHRHELVSGSVLQDRNFGGHASEVRTDAASFQLSKTDFAV